MKFEPRIQHWTMFKNIPQTIKKHLKYYSQIGPKNWIRFRGGDSWGTFGGAVRFLALEISPQRSQRAPNDGTNTPKMIPKTSQVAKKTSKYSLFGTWPGGLRVALTT